MLKIFSLISFIIINFYPKVLFAETSTMIAKKQPDSELSVLGLVIGKSTLTDVMTKFKSKEIYHEGDQGDVLSFLCYKASNGITLSFESKEKGSDKKTITAIAIKGSQSPYRLSKFCEKTSLIKTKLAINGLSLGMSPDLVKRLKGKPSKESGNNIIYQFEVQENSVNGVVTIASNLEIEFNQSMISGLTASRAEIY